MNDTRDFIVERAFCLFLQRGYEGISIRDIQEAVELSKGAIYHYFRSKEEIFGEAMDRYLLPAIQTLPEALESESATPLRDAMDASLGWRDAYIARLRQITGGWAGHRAGTLAESLDPGGGQGRDPGEY